MELTQDYLRSLLNYNTDTGEFIWLVRKGSNAQKGAVAGSLAINGYIRIVIDGVFYKAHRLAFMYMEGSFPEHHTDHINQKRADNRWENLRKATHAENSRNKLQQSNNTSGCTGVIWHKGVDKWLARIKVGGRGIYLGIFTNKEDAIAARKAAEIQYDFHPNHGRIPENA